MKSSFLRFLCVLLIIGLLVNQGGIVSAASTSAPSASDVTVTNNSGSYDIIVVTGLAGGDKVNIYNAETGGKLLGSATVSAYKGEAVIKVSQLGTDAGYVYISVTSKGETESGRTKVGYSAEVQTNAPDSGNVVVTNNAGKPDLIYVTGLYGGETIKVYTAASGGKLLSTAVVPATATEYTVRISQIGIDAGSLYITLANKGELESNRTRVDYDEEPKTTALSSSNISVVNNAGFSDSVTVTYLSLGDTVNIYDAPKGGNLLATGKVPSSKTEVSMTIAQLSKEAGIIYVTLTSLGRRESSRTAVAYSAENASSAPAAVNISVVNNGNSADAVTVEKLSDSDVVKVYDSPAGGNLLGSGTVKSPDTKVVITIPQLASQDGAIYISVTNKGKFESTRTKKFYSDEPVSEPINTGSVTVINNVDKADSVSVTGLASGDIIKVYSYIGDNTPIGTATVAASNTDVTLTITQLGTKSGYIYITRTSKGKLESTKTQVNFPAETISDTVNEYNITVSNNPAGKSDIIQVKGLNAGDIIKVYDLAANGTLLGSATVPNNGTEAVVTVTQLGKEAGYVYVTVTSKGKNESSRIKVGYLAEATSGPADSDNITVKNNVTGTADTVEVTGLTGGDLIKVYDSELGGSVLGSTTVPSNSSYATVSIPQLGTAAGEVYVSITSTNKLESGRVKVTYMAEGVSAPVSAENITVTNNSENQDTVEVTGLAGGDIIRVYDAARGGALLGSAVVSAYASSAVVTITQLGIKAGSVYVSITSTNKLESSRTKSDYEGEARSEVIDAENIIIANNAGTSDTVQIAGLNVGDKVYVYSAAAGGTLLGSATASAGTEVTISIAQLGTAAGSVYIAVSNPSKTQSERVKADYAAEAKTQTPSAENVEITNNVGTSDTIKVTGLSSGDKVNVYSAAKAGTLLGSKEADTNASSVSIPVTQLGSSEGSVYISITNKTKLESERTKADYLAEAVTDAPSNDQIIITNNAGMSDTIEVTELSGGDVVNIYDSARVGNLLGTAEAGTYASSVTVTITQLGSVAGSVYISVTGKNKLSSARTKVDFPAEPKSAALSTANIVITNNAGIDDLVKVTGLTGGDEIRVYNAAAGGTLLGSATASTYQTYATVTIEQLGGLAASVYVTVIKKGCQESTRVKASFAAEPASGAAHISNILVYNNAGTADIVKINNLSGGDKVNIYNAATGGNLLGSATVDTYDSAVSVTITQLGSSAGSIYVSVITNGKLESERTKVAYAAEQKNDPPAVGNITVTNNAGLADLVRVSYLDAGDIVKVYNAASDGTLLGSGTVAAGETEVTVSISQLSAAAGNVYVSVTSPKKLESDRTTAYYSAEAGTDAPQLSNITITNNAIIADTVKVSFLKPEDVVRVYNKSYGGSLLGSASVAEDATEATVTISKLDAAGGTLYVTVTSLGKAESGRTKATYSAEQQAEAPSASNINVYNNAGMADTIIVTFLDPYDVVKVYTASSGGTVLGTATVGKDGSQVTIKIAQLGAAAGNVYVSVTGYGKLESDRTLAYYSAEPVSDVPDVNGITITNYAGKSDTIRVTGLMEYDVVNIYSSATGGTLLGTGTVDENDDEITVKINQLGTSSGYVYISVTSLGAYESARVKVGYTAEN